MMFFYLTPENIIEIHDNVINESGGLEGINNFGLIESAAYQIQNDDYYPEFSEKLAHLIFSINKGHAFLDGNKRTSLISGALMLFYNGMPPEMVNLYSKEMEDVVVWVADNRCSKYRLNWLLSYLTIPFFVGINNQNDKKYYQNLISLHKRLIYLIESHIKTCKEQLKEIQQKYPTILHIRSQADSLLIKELEDELLFFKKALIFLNQKY